MQSMFSEIRSDSAVCRFDEKHDEQRHLAGVRTRVRPHVNKRREKVAEMVKLRASSWDMYNEALFTRSRETRSGLNQDS